MVPCGLVAGHRNGGERHAASWPIDRDGVNGWMLRALLFGDGSFGHWLLEGCYDRRLCAAEASDLQPRMELWRSQRRVLWARRGHHRAEMVAYLQDQLGPAEPSLECWRRPARSLRNPRLRLQAVQGNCRIFLRHLRWSLLHRHDLLPCPQGEGACQWGRLQFMEHGLAMTDSLGRLARPRELA